MEIADICNFHKSCLKFGNIHVPFCNFMDRRHNSNSEYKQKEICKVTLQKWCYIEVDDSK